MRGKTVITPLPQGERGQALIEYALILALVAIGFGLALAATGPVLGNVFSNAIYHDLLRQTEIGELPSREEFWATVTAAASKTPVERPIPSNTPAPPTVDPTAGPSPTPTQTFTPSPTKPTATPSLTPTPTDIIHNAPIYDSIDNPEWWRTDPNVFLGGLPWQGRFFPDSNMGGTPILRNGIWELNYNGEFIDNWPASSPGQNFSARFTRTIGGSNNGQPVFNKDTTLVFRATYDDRIRVSITSTGDPACASPCMLIDDWANTGSIRSQARPFLIRTGIEYTVQVEYAQGSGDAVLQLAITKSGGSPDDTAATGSGTFDCNWGRTDRLRGNDANTELYMWEEYAGGDMPANSRCYLEWRGAVNLGALTSPEMIFWDVWDLPGGVTGWLEVAEYIPTGSMSVPVPKRDSFDWQRIDLRTPNTRNYNWTRNVVNLADVNGRDYRGKYVAFRFVIQNTNASSGPIRWYVDDVQFRERNVKTFTLAHPVWNLNDAAQAADFITTGGKSNAGHISGWALVSNHKFGPSGMSWHDSVGPEDDQSGVAGTGNNGGTFSDYKRNTESPATNANRDLRMHTLEFAGWVDLQNIPPQDAKGNTGEPQLSFYHAFDVGARTGLEVQYTTDGYSTVAPQWKTFTDGQIRTVDAAGNSTPQLAMREQEISLAELPGNPPRIRIRWVLSVHTNAERRDGWWIDQIRLGRAEAPKWVDYPFADDAQDYEAAPWRMTGQWGLSDTLGRPGISEPANADYKRMSYASGQYGANDETALEMRYPVDLFNDTTNKIFYNRDGTSNTHAAPAVRPMLSFYHIRGIGAGDEFRVEWKRIDESSSSWRNLWIYRPLMAPAGPSPATISGTQLAWERVEIDLNPLMRILNAENTNSNRDDDIVFQFVLKSDGGVNGRGLNIDDLLIEEYEENVIKLWPRSEERTNPANSAQNYGKGDGVTYIDEADFSNKNRPWWESWHNGGRWNAVNWEAWTGVFSFHESPIGGQGRAPTGDDGVDVGAQDWFYNHQTLSIMELDTIIDLRPVDAINEAPVLYFWSRYHLGVDDHILVQISTEMTGNDTQIDSSMISRCGVQTPQCYDQVRGWNAWRTVWERPNRGGNGSYPRQEMRSYAWTREQIDLAPYAYDPAAGTPGQRIRIRFVVDGLENGDNKDGWYIDNMTIQYRQPPALPPIVFAEGGALDDSAQDLTNWITEGRWGLDPTVFEGSGGAPTSIGLWDFKWWDCSTCADLADPSTPEKSRFADGARAFLQNPPAADRNGQTFDINYDFGGGSPVAGWDRKNYIVGQWTLDTPVIGGTEFPSGSRSFITRSDDGVRLFAQELDGSGQPTGQRTFIINNWTDHQVTTDMGAFNFQYGKRYRLTLQYYEKEANGTIILTVGAGRFSFSDSPKLSVGPDVPAINYGNSSLTLRRILDLRGMPANASVIMVHRTKYQLAQNSTNNPDDRGNEDIARVEVSRDGGFSWSSANLRDPLESNAVGLPAMSSPTYNGTRTNSWEERWNNLTKYKGSQVIIRFRLDRQNSWCARRNDCLDNNSDDAARTQPMYYNGWWITRVRVLGT